MQRYAHLLIIPVVFFGDRWTKILIVEHMQYLSSIEVTSFLSIVHARNYGGAFGFLSQHGASTIIFLVFPIVIIAGLIYYLLRYRHPLLVNIALACILAGALGNIYDRLLYGYVTDFIDVYYGKYHWPAFNVADASITCGIGLWMFTQLLGPGSRAQGPERKPG
ncbi:MAG: lipoprotein signal peptidase [Deltaproteobacteria bacterium]|jgi:signal peptidase II|nr:lipoprotein signal peptidase [Deltaproteobacteria bacterium]